MDHLSSEHKPGTDSPILMREGEVNRGPLKNDVSISMLILGLHQSNSFSLNSGTGYQSSAVLLSVGGRGQSRVTQHCHSPDVASLQTSPGLICSWETVLAQVRL